MMTTTEMKIREREQRQARVERFQQRVTALKQEISRATDWTATSAHIMRELDAVLYESADLAREPLLEHMEKITAAAVNVSLMGSLPVMKQEPNDGK